METNSDNTRRDSANSYIGGLRSAQGTPDRYRTQTLYNTAFYPPQQQQQQYLQQQHLQRQQPPQLQQPQQRHMMTHAMQPYAATTPTAPFAVVGGRPLTHEELEARERHMTVKFGPQYVVTLSPESKQRFMQYSPEEQYQIVYRELMRQRQLISQRKQALQQQQQQVQQQQQQLSQQPSPPVAPATPTSTSTLREADWSPVKQFAQKYFAALDPQRRHKLEQLSQEERNQLILSIYTQKKQEHARQLHAQQLQQQQQQQNNQQLQEQLEQQLQQQQHARQLLQQQQCARQSQRMQQLQPDPRQHAQPTAAHTNQSSSRGVGTKRSLPDGDNEARASKVAKISKASGPHPSSISRAAKVPVQKAAATKQVKSQDATIPKKPRGRPRKIPETNETPAKQVLTTNPPAVPTPPSSQSQPDARELVDLTEPEQIQPLLYTPPPSLADPSSPHAEEVIERSPEHQLHHHSHQSGVAMTDLETGLTIQDSMTNYLSELESHRRSSVKRISESPTIPLFTDNTMNTAHAEALGLPTHFSMESIRKKVKDPTYDGYAPAADNNDVVPSQLAHKTQEYSLEAGEKLTAAITEFLQTTKQSAQPDGESANDPPITEEHAQLQWEMLNQTATRGNDECWGADFHGMSTWN
jgi:hypothetical protein